MQVESEVKPDGVEARADLADAIDFSLPFMPEELTPLSHTPVYLGLDARQRLRYNQLHALYFNEQTMFFEKSLARTVLGYFLARPMPDELLHGLGEFLAEEELHTAMFRDLNLKCDPARYARDGFHFIRVPPLARRLLASMARRPNRFPLLLWLMHLQEERAIAFGRAFLKSTAPLEPHFVAAQRRHLADEIGHVRWDGVLLDRVWSQTGILLRHLNARLLAWMVNEFFATPKRSAVRVVVALAAEFPELKPSLPEMRNQLKLLGECPEFRRSLYSPGNVPQTFRRFDFWPEFQALTKAMPGYQPGAGL